MKLMIIGSMAFSHDMVSLQQKLNKLGHDAQVPHGIEPHLEDETFVDNLEGNSQFVIENNIMKRCFDQVAESDGVVVLNKKRNGMDGYIGISALMEMAIAHHLNKKIYIIYPIPSFDEARWAQEVTNMQPIIVNENLELIK